MARPKKESKPFNIKMSAGLYDRLEKYCDEMGQTKTTAVERILIDALDRHDEAKYSHTDEAGKRGRFNGI